MGDLTRVYNGVDVEVNGRFGRGGLLTGGISVGRIARNDCALNATPQAFVIGAAWDGGNNTAQGGESHPRSTAYCDTAPPWSKSFSLKLNGVYPLPYGFDVSGVFQNIPGVGNFADRTYTNAELAPILGRPLAATAPGRPATLKIPLVPPDTLFEDRLTQLDVRLTKIFQFGEWRLKADLDVYNAFNQSAVRDATEAFGSNWLNAERIMFGRLVKIGARVEF